MTYSSCGLSEYLRHANERFVEVLDCLGSILWGLVADIANAASGEVLDIRDGELGEVLAHVILRELRRQTTNEYA
jgi:hypothetical protein